MSDGASAELLPQIPYPEPPPILKAVEPPPSKPSGLFAELLGRPDVLHADAVEHDGRYDAPTVKLLEELVTSGRPPTNEERRLLDDATFTFATEKTAAEHVKPPPMRKPVLSPKDEDDEEGADAADVPLDAIPPFWWRNG